MTVQTARGPINADQLGTTLMHEHVFVLDPAVVRDYGAAWWDADDRVDDAVAKLQAARSSGIDTIVDVTVLGIGRDIDLLARVARRTDVNLVLSTGLYTYDEIPRLFRNHGIGRAIDDDEPMIRAFLGDIREGIGGTTIRANMLKAVWETPELSASALRAHRAIAQTQIASRVPVTVHTNSALQTGREVVRFYRQEGADLSRLVIAHAGDSTDMAYLCELLEAGVTLGFDRFGLDSYGGTPARVRTLAELCAKGAAAQIVLSQDAAAFTESWATPAAQDELRRRLPDWHYTFVVDSVLGRLLEVGVTAGQTEQMMAENARRLLDVDRAWTNAAPGARPGSRCTPA